MAWFKLTRSCLALTTAIGALAGCEIDECLLFPDRDRCTTIVIVNDSLNLLSRYQPRSVLVKFTEPAAIAALAAGSTPSLTIRRSAADAPAVCPRKTEIKQVNLQVPTGPNPPTVVGTVPQNELKNFCGTQAELVARLPGRGESNALKFELCAPLAFTPVLVPAPIAGSYIQAAVVQPDNPGHLLVMSCGTKGCCLDATALVAGQLKPAPGSCDSNRTISASAQFRAIGQQTLSDDLRALTYYDNDGLPPTPILKHYRLNASSANLQTVPKANPGSRLVGGSKPDLVALVGTSSVVVFDALRTSDSKPIEEVPLNLNIPAIPSPPQSVSPHWSAVASYPSERASDFLFIPSPDSFRNSVESQKLALDSSVVLVQDHQQLWRDAARSQKLQAQFQQGSPLSGAILAMAATDLDGDEQLDVLFIENGPEPKLRVFGGSGCNPGLVIPTPPECLVKGARIEVGDINNDGATDIVISNLTDPAHPGAPGTTPINLCVLVNEFYSR